MTTQIVRGYGMVWFKNVQNSRPAKVEYTWEVDVDVLPLISFLYLRSLPPFWGPWDLVWNPLKSMGQLLKIPVLSRLRYSQNWLKFFPQKQPAGDYRSVRRFMEHDMWVYLKTMQIPWQCYFHEIEHDQVAIISTGISPDDFNDADHFFLQPINWMGMNF